jgi:hypothetical protein
MGLRGLFRDQFVFENPNTPTAVRHWSWRLDQQIVAFPPDRPPDTHPAAMNGAGIEGELLRTVSGFDRYGGLARMQAFASCCAFNRIMSHGLLHRLLKEQLAFRNDPIDLCNGCQCLVPPDMGLKRGQLRSPFLN